MPGLARNYNSTYEGGTPLVADYAFLLAKNKTTSLRKDGKLLVLPG
jgi:hypothetical protein